MYSDDLIYYRRKILSRGYARITDIQKFFGCGYKNAKKIYDDISDEVQNEGKIVSPLGISANRLLKYMDLNQDDIFLTENVSIQNNLPKQNRININ